MHLIHLNKIKPIKWKSNGFVHVWHNEKYLQNELLNFPSPVDSEQGKEQFKIANALRFRACKKADITNTENVRTDVHSIFRENWIAGQILLRTRASYAINSN